jgi:hypothetical protein
MTTLDPESIGREVEDVRGQTNPSVIAPSSSKVNGLLNFGSNPNVSDRDLPVSVLQ